MSSEKLGIGFKFQKFFLGEWQAMKLKADRDAEKLLKEAGTHSLKEVHEAVLVLDIDGKGKKIPESAREMDKKFRSELAKD